MTKSAESRRMLRIIQTDDHHSVVLLQAAGLLNPNMMIRGESALSHAIRAHARNVTTELLKAGADINERPSNAHPRHHTPLWHATNANDPNLFTIVWQHATKPQNPTYREQILEERIASNDQPNVNEALTQHPTTQIDSMNVITLMVAHIKHAPHRTHPITPNDIQWVLDTLRKHDPNYTTDTLHAALHHCSTRNVPTSILQHLLNQGADPNHTIGGRNALTHAILNHAPEAATLLIPHTHDLNATTTIYDDAPETPLDLAVPRLPQIIHDLTERGATSTDGTIRTALQKGFSANSTEIIQTILTYPLQPEDYTTILTNAIQQPTPTILHAILQTHPHLARTPLHPHQTTPLTHAIHPHRANPNTIKLLTQHATPLTQPQPDKSIPLHDMITHAIERQPNHQTKHPDTYLNTIKQTLHATPNIHYSVRDIRGDTVLHRAVRANYYDLVEILSIAGADPRVPDYDGRNAIELATVLRRRRIAERLKLRLGIRVAAEQRA